MLNSYMQDLSSVTEKWSGPGTELFFRLLISSSIIFGENWMSVRDGLLEPVRVKKASGSVIFWFGSGWENTDEYCEDSCSQISWGEFIRVPSTFNGPIPPFTI